MKFKVGDVVRDKGNADIPEMRVVFLKDKCGKLTCNWDDKNGEAQIWTGTPDQLELVEKKISIDLDSMTRPRE